ncbi:hypothetical protein OC610_08670 [Pseudomonas sp. SAICEU22]|uniref:Uncharacterized protein n=1 Tax=Pseudomonas agronomica TaxID=2979328 RepID=A0ABT3F5V0_9PSED|nr:hypothetical protein [Pseudomonas agronomica]MCW1244476.1 hypothetical protein [Pseudomonas agronomica]
MPATDVQYTGLELFILVHAVPQLVQPWIDNSPRFIAIPQRYDDLISTLSKGYIENVANLQLSDHQRFWRCKLSVKLKC